MKRFFLLGLAAVFLPLAVPRAGAQSAEPDPTCQTCRETQSLSDMSFLKRWWVGENASGFLTRASTYVRNLGSIMTPPEEWENQFYDYCQNRSGATADWFGLGKPMNDYGLSVTGALKYVYFGEVAGGFPSGSGQPRSNFIPEVKMRFLYDFAKVFGLDGLTIQSNWRYRNVAGNNPGYAAGTTGVTSGWNPTDMSSGWGLRMLAQYLEFSTRNKEVTVNGGLMNPYDSFLQQPLSKFFENNMVNSSKGIGATAGPGIPVPGGTTNTAPRLYGAPGVSWSSSYLAWGGSLKIAPSRETYIQSGLYEAVAADTGVSASQYSVTSVYPYSTVPASYLGQFKSSGQIVPIVGVNGQAISGKYQNMGWVPSYQNNHGFTMGGAPKFNPTASQVNVKPSVPPGAGFSSYASSPYNQGGVGGNWSGNGLFNVNEIGCTPKFTADKLEGRYALGTYVWGLPNYFYTPTSYTVTVYNPATGKYGTGTSVTKKPYPISYNGAAWGIYLQADQMIFRHHESAQEPAASDGKATADKNPVASKKTLSERGLLSFNEFSFTPPQQNAMPFYFQTGLVYKGLLDARPKDQIGIVCGMGFYSSYLNSWTQSQNQALVNAYGNAVNATAPNGPTNINPVTGKTTSDTGWYPAYQPNYTTTEVIEGFYNVQINKWASFKPYAQCLINPAGNGTLPTVWTLGARLAVVF